jgi:hypothetical protein
MAGPYIARLEVHWDGTTERSTGITWLITSTHSWMYVHLRAEAPNHSHIEIRSLADQLHQRRTRRLVSRELMEMLERAILTREPHASGIWLREAIAQCLPGEPEFKDIPGYFDATLPDPILHQPTQ